MWVRGTEHAPRGPFDLLERIHGLAEIVERGGGVMVECLRVNPPRLERVVMVLAEDALSVKEANLSIMISRSG